MKTQLFVLLILMILLASCSTAAQLPPEAQAALTQYWDNLPAGSHNFQIIRAWQGEFPTESYPSDSPRMEIWCVEAKDVGQESPEEDAALIWFVTRQESESEWSAGLLMAMSSIWPYQACGVSP